MIGTRLARREVEMMRHRCETLRKDVAPERVLVLCKTILAMDEALEALLDEQNGPPLLGREDEWDEAVAKARAARLSEEG